MDKPYRILDGHMLEVVESKDFTVLLDILEIIVVSVTCGSEVLITGKHNLSVKLCVDADFYPWLKNLLLNRELLADDNNSFRGEGREYFFTPDFNDD